MPAPSSNLSNSPMQSQNSSPESLDQPQTSDPDRSKLRSLELKENLGHRWWGWTLFLVALASPALAIPATKLEGIQILLAYLVLVLVLPICNFFRALYQYDYNAYQWVEEGFEKPIPSSEQPPETKTKIAALFRGLIRLEFFGWIVWVSSSGAAVAAALYRNQVWFELDQESFVSLFSFLMNEASFDLIRATVIGTIVLFFAQLIRKFQNTIDKADLAARNAESAALKASNTIAESNLFVPLLNDSINRTLSVLKTSYRILESETLSHHLARTLELIVSSHSSLKQVEELSGRIVARISQINEEITHSYTRENQPSRDTFDLLTLSAIYTTYLKVETLSFEGYETGTKACRLSTRYPHYALAVRSVVKALESLNEGRYRYYTIFNRAPEHFFNPENPNVESPLGNINWSFLFLEEFCGWHNREKIPYTRYFIMLDDDTGREGKIPPTLTDIRAQLPVSRILCFRKGNEWRPILCGDSVWNFFPADTEASFGANFRMYSQTDLESMKSTARVIVPPPDIQVILQDLGDLLKSDPSYIIVTEQNENKVKRVISQTPDLDLLPLKEVLDKYHNPEIRPKVLRIETWGAYQDFFGRVVPKDLFAVWDCQDQKWCLCIGTMAGESDPTAVEMVCTTPQRQLLSLPWEQLERKLTDLFCEDPTELRNCGITREDL